MKHQEQIAIVARLRSFHAKDHEEWLGDVLRRWIADPVKPRTNEGNLRINPIVILLTGMAVLAGVTFFFFSLVQQ
jgi:hypothetical protein